MRHCQAIVTILLSAALSAGHAATAADAPEPHPAPLPPLRWAADAEGGAPYIFKDASDPNLNVGFEVDLAVALEKELGRVIEEGPPHRVFNNPQVPRTKKFLSQVLG